MSLADSLLADLDDLSDEEPETGNQDAKPVASSSKRPVVKGSMLPPPLPSKVTNANGSNNGSSSLKRSSLAMELEDDDDEEEDARGDAGLAGIGAGEEEDEGDGGMKLDNGVSAVGYVPEGGVRPAEELDEEEVEKTDLKDVEDVGKIAKLLKGKKLTEVLKVSHQVDV